jgi:four helix bundle protein
VKRISSGQESQMEKIRNFRDLEVWKLGKVLVLLVYRVAKKFPQEELYGLVSQMWRAAVSVPSNVAEGFNRRHNAEYRQFLYIALGSCAELETHVEIAHDLRFLTAAEMNDLLEQLDHESKMLRNLIKRL